MASKLSGVDRIIDYTARTEGGGSYDAWNPDDNGAGVSFGLIQFNQRKGALPELFQAMRERDPAKFDRIFGEYVSGFLDPDWVRGADLNSSELMSRVMATASVPAFQQVQRDVAKKYYYSQAEQLARQFKLKSERALAMLFDSFVQWSPGKVKANMAEAAQGGGPEKQVLRRFAPLMDAGRFNRRQRMLDDPNLSDGPVWDAKRKLIYAATGVGILLLLWKRR